MTIQRVVVDIHININLTVALEDKSVDHQSQWAASSGDHKYQNPKHLFTKTFLYQEISLEK